MAPRDEQADTAPRDETRTTPGFVVYEVLARLEPHGPYVEQGSFLAGSPEMAVALARENFLRRREVYGIWVVPRDAIAELEGEDLRFRIPKPYREVSDYQYLIEKWRHYHQNAMTPDTMA